MKTEQKSETEAGRPFLICVKLEMNGKACRTEPCRRGKYALLLINQRRLMPQFLFFIFLMQVVTSVNLPQEGGHVTGIR